MSLGTRKGFLVLFFQKSTSFEKFLSVCDAAAAQAVPAIPSEGRAKGAAPVNHREIPPGGIPQAVIEIAVSIKQGGARRVNASVDLHVSNLFAWSIRCFMSLVSAG